MVQNAAVVLCNRAAYFVTDDREFGIKSDKLFRRKREPAGPLGVEFLCRRREGLQVLAAYDTRELVT